MSDLDPVHLDVSRAGVAYVTLARPEKRNAFNALVIEKLADAFETLRASDARIIFLRGEGKAFSAGADLEWMQAAADYTRAENEDDALALAEMLRKLYELPQLTVALVQGAAMGGGAGLVAACDVGVSVVSAKFRFSEVRLGLIPAAISPFVIDAIGRKWARALFASGEMFDGIYAEKISLVQYTVKEEAGLAEMAEHLAQLALETGPEAVHEAKRLVWDVAGREINHDLMKLTSHRIAEQRASAEGKEGVSAFLEKRKPDWAG